ncbi:Plasmid stabilization protein (fragment) [uncultured Defluviicoccus sp.]|uniref:Plasmid stabilization protein n=1 Tax=metagenome TaxID=256318 RepID=A0A380TG33_9ZZZZ
MPRFGPGSLGGSLDIDEDVLLTWRRMVERRRLTNHTFSQLDLFITRKVDNFTRVEMAVFNPWTGHLDQPGQG